MTYRAFDNQDVPACWGADFSIPDATFIEDLPDEQRAIVERYVHAHVVELRDDYGIDE